LTQAGKRSRKLVPIDVGAVRTDNRRESDGYLRVAHKRDDPTIFLTDEDGQFVDLLADVNNGVKVRRGNPRDPLNRERLRSLLSEVMIRNARSLVSIHLPARYAQTFIVRPKDPEAEIYHLLENYLREKSPEVNTDIERAEDSADTNDLFNQTISGNTPADETPPTLTRMQIQTLISASGSHPCALSASLEKMDGQNERTRTILGLIGKIRRSAKEDRMLELLKSLFAIFPVNSDSGCSCFSGEDTFQNHVLSAKDMVFLIKKFVEVVEHFPKGGDVCLHDFHVLSEYGIHL
jgi:hypothetical protein